LDSVRISIDSIKEIRTSSDRGGEDTTPIIRPWYNIRSRQSNDKSDDEDEDEEDRDVIQSSPGSVGSTDEHDEAYGPTTPSRLLTISSMDFEDTLVSPSKNMMKSNARVQTVDDDANDGLTFDADVCNEFESMERDVRQHDDIITDYMNKLNMSAQAHLSSIIQRLLQEKDTALRSRDEFFTKQMQKQQAVIDDLNTVLARTESQVDIERLRCNRFTQKLSVQFTKTQERYVSIHSMSRAFSAWRQSVREEIIERRRERMADKARVRHLLRISFSCLSRESAERRMNRRYNEAKVHFDITLKELVVKYEGDLERLKAELREAHTVIQQERLRRQQLEEDLRRMFLKNMTAMNMEALSLFQNPSDQQLASFGPAAQRAWEVEELARQTREQEALRTEMRNQQQNLKTHHKEFVDDWQHRQHNSAENQKASSRGRIGLGTAHNVRQKPTTMTSTSTGKNGKPRRDSPLLENDDECPKPRHPLSSKELYR